MNKQGSATWIWILLALIVVIAAYLIILGGRECNKNSDCKPMQYCGADHKCHDMQVVYVEKNSLLEPAIIISIAIVIGAIILRWKRF